jgi:hypothetical protein
VTNRVGVNAAIDDVDFGIRLGALLSSFVDLQSVGSFRRLNRVASGSIARRIREQFEVAIFRSRVVRQPAAAYGDGPGSKVGDAGPVASAAAMSVHSKSLVSGDRGALLAIC